MNEILKSKLNVIADDELLIKALKAVFDETAEKEAPGYVSGESNEALGERYRAYIQSKVIILNAFDRLNNYKVGTKTEEKPNRGK